MPVMGGPSSVIRLFRSGFGAFGLSPRLEGEKVYVRPPVMGDWKAWSELRDASRDFLVPWEPSWPADALSRAAFLRRLRRSLAERRDDQGYGFLTFERGSDKLVGGITLGNVRRGVAQMATLGYWAGEAYAQRGYTSEAVRLVVAFAFNQLHLHRIEAACLPANQPSRRLLERAGFVQEGYAKQYLRINGEWCDHVLYGLVREQTDSDAS